jgi:hypothetical protein
VVFKNFGRCKYFSLHSKNHLKNQKNYELRIRTVQKALFSSLLFFNGFRYVDSGYEYNLHRGDDSEVSIVVGIPAVKDIVYFRFDDYFTWITNRTRVTTPCTSAFFDDFFVEAKF